MASERFNAAAAGDLTPVPCRGGAPLAQALRTGEVRCALPGAAGARAQIQGGRREALGQLRVPRSELGPDLPTLTGRGPTGGVDSTCGPAWSPR